MSRNKIKKASRLFIENLLKSESITINFMGKEFCKIEKYKDGQEIDKDKKCIYYTNVVFGTVYPVELYLHNYIVCGIDFNLLYPCIRYSSLFLDFLKNENIPWMILDYFTLTENAINLSEKNFSF